MAKKKRAVVKGRSILALDVLGEVRRAQRILGRVEKFLVQDERRRRASAQRVEQARGALDGLDLAGQS